MSATVRKLLDEAKKLSKEDRALFRAELEALDDQTSSSEEVAEAWSDEITRRVATIKDGTANLYDHDEVMRELDEVVRR